MCTSSILDVPEGPRCADEGVDVCFQQQYRNLHLPRDEGEQNKTKMKTHLGPKKVRTKNQYIPRTTGSTHSHAWPKSYGHIIDPRTPTMLGRRGEGVYSTSCMTVVVWSYHRPSHHYNTGTEHAGFSPTRQTLIASSVKRREMLDESHKG